MTDQDRDQLRSLALRVLLDADDVHEPDGPMWSELAAAFVDAGWRPSPSGDVIREAKAEAWDDGFKEGLEWPSTSLVELEDVDWRNPYRVDGGKVPKNVGSV